MIGKLIYASSLKRLVAILDDDLHWQCDDEAERLRLTRQFPIITVEGVPNMVIGRHVLYQAAERLGGSVEVQTMQRSAMRELV